MAIVAEGLEGVVVTKTALSDVDGEAGRLVVGGSRIEDLSGTVSFEAATALLLFGAQPDAPAVARARAGIARGRVMGHEALASRRALLERDDAMDALRGAIASLPSQEADIEGCLTLVGQVGTFVAAHARVRRGEALVAPDPERGHAEDFLRMASRAASPSPALVRALDAYLVAVIDHGMNASTFTARVVASTGSDLVSAIAAAIGALKGPLHGGAPGPVLDMLDAIGDAARARPWLEGEIAAKRRIMGMGHRIYRVRDPRAAVLERALSELERSDRASADRLALARAVEREATDLLAGKSPERALKANVEFYTAVVLDAVGLDRKLFAATFAVGRVAGWCAHVREQKAKGRLIRPASLYDGPVPAGPEPEGGGAGGASEARATA